MGKVHMLNGIKIKNYYKINTNRIQRKKQQNLNFMTQRSS
jgi:hypothetical protein